MIKQNSKNTLASNQNIMSNQSQIPYLANHIPINNNQTAQSNDKNLYSIQPPSNLSNQPQNQYQNEYQNQYQNEPFNTEQPTDTANEHQNKQQRLESQSNQQSGNALQVQNLQQILSQKICETKQLRLVLADKRKEIKSINQEIDKQVNRSMIKHLKPVPNVSIHSIFHMQHQEPVIKQLTAQLNKVRNQCKKMKEELRSLGNKVNGPVNLIHIEKGGFLKSKIKQMDSQMNRLREQRQFLQKQMKKIKQQEAQLQFGGEQEIKINKQKNQWIISDIKDIKNSLYEVQKQDRLVTQKLRYMQTLQKQSAQAELRKNRITVGVMSKEQIAMNVRQVTEEIQEIIQERNKTQIQRKTLLKNLENDVRMIEAKNWDLVNKLRQIDSMLIRHYNSRLKKPKTVQQHIKDKTMDLPEKDKNLQLSTKSVKTASVYSFVMKNPHKNDKNKAHSSFIESQNSSIPLQQSRLKEQQPIQMIEKRKNYDYFMAGVKKPFDMDQIILSDQFLGLKIKIKNINFIVNNSFIYGISADYVNQNNKSIKGYKISSKIRPKEIISKQFTLSPDKDEVINYIQVGINQNEHIGYINIITSEARQFKWGNLDSCVKNEHKNIRKYESIVLKGKLGIVGQNQGPNCYCLDGIGFIVAYLAPK